MAKYGKAKVKYGKANAEQGEARRSKAMQTICYRRITGGYLAGANLAGDFCEGKSAQ